MKNQITDQSNDDLYAHTKDGLEGNKEDDLAGSDVSLLEEVLVSNFKTTPTPLSKKQRKQITETFEVRLLNGTALQLNLAELYRDDEDGFRRYVTEKLTYYQQRRKNGQKITLDQIVNSLRNVLDERFGWIAYRDQWRRTHAPEAKPADIPVRGSVYIDDDSPFDFGFNEPVRKPFATSESAPTQPGTPSHSGAKRLVGYNY